MRWPWWLETDVPKWHFWNPQSGLIGGLIGVVVGVGFALLAAKILFWE